MKRSQHGSILVMALLMITVVALILGATLELSHSSITSGLAIRDLGRIVYAADGGVERAIESIRRDPSLGMDPAQGGTCPTRTYTDTNGETIQVTCEGLAGSGGPGDPSAPRNAILTLSRDEDGIDLTSNNTMRVGGAVKSNSNIAVAAGSALEVTGPVFARTGCTGIVVSLPPPGSRQCDVGNEFIPASGDPGYLPQGTDGNVPGAPVGNSTSCPTGSQWLVTLNPGRYTNVNQINDFTNSARCAGAVVHFTPGIYYFDFGNAEIQIARDVHVVAGTPVVVLDPVGIRPIIPFPGGCLRTGGPAIPGVQFIFNGASRMSITRGRVELCPYQNTNTQRISIYQKAALPDGSPGWARPTGCIVQTGPSGCPLLSGGAPGPRFVSWGTVYAPSAEVDVQLVGVSEQILGRGVISRVLRMHITASSNYIGNLIEVPAGAVADRVVRFIARTPDGRTRVRVIVRFQDGGGDAPGEVVDIQSWSVLR